MLKITPHPPLSRSPFSRWRRLSIRFFFCTCRRKRKSYQKENADGEISRFAKRDEDSASSTSAPFKKKVHENYNAKREEREFIKSRFRSCP